VTQGLFELNENDADDLAAYRSSQLFKARYGTFGPGSPDEVADAALDRIDLRMKLEPTLKDLTSRQRRVLYLLWEKGLSGCEAAIVLKVHHVTVEKERLIIAKALAPALGRKAKESWIDRLPSNKEATE
jgi:DNA-directed RNA polymerase specialized sigma24 family protein